MVLGSAEAGLLRRVVGEGARGCAEAMAAEIEKTGGPGRGAA
ncbi:MAG TPA: hypothetical protein VIU15_13920 [Streptomyces sp.]